MFYSKRTLKEVGERGANHYGEVESKDGGSK
jgi:hypothetical protein